MGKAAALLAVKQTCRHNHTVPAESKTVPASKGRSKTTLSSNHSPFPTSIQGLARLLEQGKQPRAGRSRRPFDTSWAFQKRARDMSVPLEVAAPWHFGNPKY